MYFLGVSAFQTNYTPNNPENVFFFGKDFLIFGVWTHAYLSSKFSVAFEILYVALDVSFRGLGFSVLLHSLTASKMYFSGGFFSFYEFFPRITSIEIEL